MFKMFSSLVHARLYKRMQNSAFVTGFWKKVVPDLLQWGSNFKVRGSWMDFSPACGRFLAWRRTHDRLTSGEFGGHSSFAMKSSQLTLNQSRVTRALYVAVTFHKWTLKLQFKIFSANLVHLCNKVSLITFPKFYFEMLAVVEILMINIRGQFLLQLQWRISNRAWCEAGESLVGRCEHSVISSSEKLQ